MTHAERKVELVYGTLTRMARGRGPAARAARRLLRLMMECL